MKKIVIKGSSRKDGDTYQVVSELTQLSKWDTLDLNDYKFSYFDYDHRNKEDDFINLMKKITSEYHIYILATPVYWYSMSGIMKVFFDRLTDLLTIEKEVGRLLRTKSMAVISCSNNDTVGEHFYVPFKKSADYLGMKFLAEMHINSTRMDAEKILWFISQIEKADGNDSSYLKH